MKRFKRSVGYKGKTNWWRSALSFFLIILASLSVMGAVAARYARDDILNTDRFVSIAGPLPSNPKVSLALTSFTTNALFNAAHAEDRIRNILPSKLAPLSGPLATVAQEKIASSTNKFVQTDTFRTIWTGGILLAHNNILKVADSKSGDLSQSKVIGEVNLGALLAAVRQLAGIDQSMLTDSNSDKTSQIKVDIRQSVESLRHTVSAIRTGAYVLPFAALALFSLGMLAAYDRRRALLVSGLSVMAVGFTLLILFKMYSGYLLGTISSSLYRDAAAVIYEAFYSDLRLRIELAVAVAILVSAMALLFGPSTRASYIRIKLGLHALSRTKYFIAIHRIQPKISGYRTYLLLVPPAIALVVALALSKLSLSTLLVSVCVVTAADSFVCIFLKNNKV